MRIRSLSILALSAVLSLVSACGGPQAGPTLSYGESARRDYERAFAAFQDDDCLTATPLFQSVRREYPYSSYAALAELRLADCELQQQHYTEAIRAYRTFIRQRPTHPAIDTANFSVARAYFKQIPQDFFLSPPTEERDQSPTRSALRVVRRFLSDYPESEHVTEARDIERNTLALLARHELYAANYYLLRNRPQATIQRIETLLAQYEGSGVEPEALILLGRTYLRMRQEGEARDAFAQVVARFPQSGFAVQARNYLRTIGTEDVEPEGEEPPGGGPPPDEEAEDDDEPLAGAIQDPDDYDGSESDPEERETDRLEDASQQGLGTELGDEESTP